MSPFKAPRHVSSNIGSASSSHLGCSRLCGDRIAKSVPVHRVHVHGLMGILLDPKIRDNVLLPIFVVVVLTSMIRSSLMILFKSDPKVDVKEVKTQSMLGRCKMLRAASHFLTEKAFKSRKAYFVKKDVGVLVKSVPKAKDPMEALSAGSDPMAATGMMKGQMVFMVSQGLLAYWVSHLFSGFLVAKTPFPLTFQFKAGPGGQMRKRTASLFSVCFLRVPGDAATRSRSDSTRTGVRLFIVLVHVAWPGLCPFGPFHHFTEMHCSFGR